MTGEKFTIVKGYKVFNGEPWGEPMDEPTEDQLYGWLQARGYSEEQAAKIIEQVDNNGSVKIVLP